MRKPNFDMKALPTPSYVVDERLVADNLAILGGVMERTGCKILLAQKAFSMFALYPLIAKTLCGTTASGLFEARLGREEMGEKEVHVFSPAYKRAEMEELVQICDHMVFNSPAQWKKWKSMVQSAPRAISAGLRVNPECSTQDHGIYDPCADGSRLGTIAANITPEDLDGIDGLHFHTLCEQNSDALEETLNAFLEKFGHYLPQMKWVNFGGGHHITRPDYDLARLERCIRRVQEYGVSVYLEPGEAVVLDTGYMVSEVLEISQNGSVKNAILDVSAACHMPDVIEMPYRPPLYESGEKGEKAHTYRLGGPTCLAGDIIGDYSFDKPLAVGVRLVFGDMALYSMVKNNTFNGMPLPDIWRVDEKGTLHLVRHFSYLDFKNRLS